jgi:hypothetical protein
MDMICPDCLEEYEFLGFEVDAETLEHYGLFRCSCSGTILFPEFLTREILEDNDLLDQIKISRRMHLTQSFGGKDTITVKEIFNVIKLESRHLERYIQDFSRESIRLLK